jgi:hypothetical protein
VAFVALPLANLIEHQLPGGGQAQPPRQPFEQRHAQFGLQLENLAIHGGSRHVQPLGSLAQGTLPGHLFEIAERCL